MVYKIKQRQTIILELVRKNFNGRQRFKTKQGLCDHDRDPRREPNSRTTDDRHGSCELEAPSVGKPVILYDANSKGSMNYLNLAKEILQKNNLTKIKQEERILSL